MENIIFVQWHYDQFIFAECLADCNFQISEWEDNFSQNSSQTRSNLYHSLHPTMTFLISYTITNLLMAFIEVLLNFSKSCFFLLRISITFSIPSFPYLHVIDRRSKVNTTEKDGGKRRNSSTTMKGIVTLLNHSFR